MSVATRSSDICRLSVVIGALRADLAVPVELSVAELLTVVVTGLGPGAAERGVAEGGWILQRTGERSLSPAATMATGGVVDGDVLQLRTRATELPPVVFDDLVDAVAVGVRTRTQRWTPTQTTQAATAFAGTLLILAELLVLSVGPGWGASSVVLGVGAVLLGVAAVVVGRRACRRGPALTMAVLTLGWAAGCGSTAFGGQHRLPDFGAVQLLGGLGAAALGAVVLLVALSDGVIGFVTVAAGALFGGLALGAALALDLDPAGTAAVVAALGLVVSPLLPNLSLRLSRLPLSVIALEQPDENTVDPREDTDTVDTQQVLGQALRADRYLTGLVGGVALALCTSAVLLAGRGVSAELLSATVSAGCLLRGRLFSGRGQRALLFGAGGAAGVAAAAAAALETTGTVRLFACAVPIAVLAAALVGLAYARPRSRSAPAMARALDWAEALLVLTALPLVSAVLGAYAALRR